MPGAAWEACVINWASLTTASPTCTSSLAGSCISSSCTISASSLSFWSALSCMLLYIKILYVQVALGFRHFENRSSTRSPAQHYLCLRTLLIERCVNRSHDCARLVLSMPASRVQGWSTDETSFHAKNSPPHSRSVVCQRLNFVPCLYDATARFEPISASTLHCILVTTQPQIFGQLNCTASWSVSSQDVPDSLTNHSLFLALSSTIGLVSRFEFNDAGFASTGTHVHNLSGCIQLMSTPANICSSRKAVSPTNGQTSDPDDLVGSTPVRVVRRNARASDPHWRAIVIGGTIGSAAGAAILGTGIYLVYRARRKQRASVARSLPTIESQPIELQPSRPSPRSDTRPQSRSSPPRASTSRVSESGPDPARPTSPEEIRVHTPEIGRATQIRASTGSQFMELFDDVRAARGRGLHDAMTAERSLSPISAPRDSYWGNEASTSAAGQASTYQPPVPASNTSDPTRSRQSSLPPGAAAPVDSVGSYRPAEGLTRNGRIQLSD